MDEFFVLAVRKGKSTSKLLASTAQDVADYAKLISGGVCSIFQLVALIARFVVLETCAE